MEAGWYPREVGRAYRRADCRGAGESAGVFATLTRYWQTLRWLRPVQIYGRVWFRLYRPRVDPRQPPPARAQIGRWRGCARNVSMIEADTFRFLGVERCIATASDWNRTDWPKLWLYNAHYFDDLVAAGAESRDAWHRRVLERWVTENPPAHGNGWEPYPISLRSVNWIKWSLAGNALDFAARHSLAIQTRYLRRRLEFHLLGNHLWANAKALVFVGAWFEGKEAQSWLDYGLKLVRRELAEQILPDGGHFERSPMYHAIVLEDVLDLLQLARLYPGLIPEKDVIHWQEIAVRMLRWLRVMSHPDGGIALFNDAALGIAPGVAALADYARALRLAVDASALSSLEALPESGYVRLEMGTAVLIADVGEIGPDFLPGHAHADTLSFELSLHGERVLVNGGTSTYEASAERLRQRGTAAHNAVVVDGVDSSEVWGSFRVARRARPFDVRWGGGSETLWLEAAHDGYRRRAGQVVHRRRWQLQPGQLQVIDTLDGQPASAQARFHFAPGAVLGYAIESGAYERVASTWHPRFGAGQDNVALLVNPTAAAWATCFFWE